LIFMIEDQANIKIIGCRIIVFLIIFFY